MDNIYSYNYSIIFEVHLIAMICGRTMVPSVLSLIPAGESWFWLMSADQYL